MIESNYTVTIRNTGDERAIARNEIEPALRAFIVARDKDRAGLTLADLEVEVEDY